MHGKKKKILLSEEYLFLYFGEIIRMEMYLENILVSGGGHFLSTVKLWKVYLIHFA